MKTASDNKGVLAPQWNTDTNRLQNMTQKVDVYFLI